MNTPQWRLFEKWSNLTPQKMKINGKLLQKEVLNKKSGVLELGPQLESLFVNATVRVTQLSLLRLGNLGSVLPKVLVALSTSSCTTHLELDRCYGPVEVNLNSYNSQNTLFLLLLPGEKGEIFGQRDQKEGWSPPTRGFNPHFLAQISDIATKVQPLSVSWTKYFPNTLSTSQGTFQSLLRRLHRAQALS